MNTLESEFNLLCENKLIPALRSTKGIRMARKRDIRIAWLGVIAFIPFLLLGSYLFLDSRGNAETFWAQCGYIATAGAPLLFAIIMRIRASDKSDALDMHFKENVIRVMLERIDSRLTYTPAKGLSQTDYLEGTIFSGMDISRYTSGDLIEGKSGMSYSRVFHKEGSGKDSNIVFDGIYFSSGFTTRCTGATYILPERTSLSKLSDSVREGSIVKFEDPNFEKLFVVRSKDQMEAYQLVTPSLMQLLVKFHSDLKECYKGDKGPKLYFSFVNSKIFVAIDTDIPLFEFLNVLPEEAAACLWIDYKYLSILVGFAEDLERMNVNAVTLAGHR